jgi:hypothetical protein
MAFSSLEYSNGKVFAFVRPIVHGKRQRLSITLEPGHLSVVICAPNHDASLNLIADAKTSTLHREML